MANTTNFGWETPDDTDLVKDGALAMRTLGNAIDTSLVDLKGGTSGQVLSKNSNTDMDFTWVTTNDADAIQNSIVDAKGDLIAASAADTPARLAVGNNGESLVADSGATTGLSWNPMVAGGRNRIINGATNIDQRGSAAAAVTVNSSTATFSVDRFAAFGQTTDGVFTVGQVTDAPSGFQYSLKATVTTADASIGSSQFYVIRQATEEGMTADFAYGTAAAKTGTLSFWVKSSLTGTFGGSIRNNPSNRSYVFSYTISSANTWEKKSITISGDTSGTWTGAGHNITWSLGDGSNRLGTAGSWSANNYTGVTGQTNVIGTLNATWQITGVQWELGTVATPFSMAGGTLAGELAACQRYYWRSTSNEAYSNIALGFLSSTTNAIILVNTPVTMRVTPTSVDFASQQIVDSFLSTFTVSGIALSSGETISNPIRINATVSGATQGRACSIRNNNSTSGYIGFSAEL